MTAYKYYVAGGAGGSPLINTQTTWVNGFQALLNNQFDNASTVFDIQEELIIGSGSFTPVKVRVNRAISSLTGEKLSDDFKLILFKDLSHSTGLGYKYYFNDNYWIVTSSEIIKNLAASAMVRRCTNMLRWTDVDGNIFSEPCVIDYEISRFGDKPSTTDLTLPGGYIQVYAQNNDRTKKIKESQRFLFGTSNNRIAYRIFGNGVRNFINQSTLNDESSYVLQFSMGINYVNESADDLVNGIADRYREKYNLVLSPASISGSIGNTFQIVPYLTLNNVPIIKPLFYTTSGSTIATVNATGLVTMASSGSVNVTGCMISNISVSAVVNVIVTSSTPSGSEIRISPLQDYILQEDTTTYDSRLYLGGALQSDAFVFSVANNLVPNSSYTFSEIDGNHFSVKNEYMYLDNTLDIICTSGSYSRMININLRGAW